ncbi:restriction endonuclease subunit S [Intrasporangium calvum]|uniref:restriction endonuclease subunit S n=1 Tax=Intrasporangium calvum TaxID=53358 RepID=UPI001902B028|nr:restriction endonuclease subunit S [Intrasporangium calvum]
MASLDYFKKQVFSRELSSYKKVDPGQFAYATIHLDEGSIGIAPEPCLISPMYTVFEADRERVDPSYLLRYLKSPRALAEYPRLGKGSVHRRRSISLQALGHLSIPLPPVEEQRRIAASLDHADALRAKRREALAVLDDLTQSIFIDTFVASGRVDNHRPIGEVLKFKSGSFLPAKEQRPGIIPVYGGNGVNGRHDQALFNEPVVVVGRVGVYCGAVHLTPGPAWVTDNALYVSGNPHGLSLNYLRHALSHLNLNQYASQSGQPLISGSRISPALIGLPSQELQDEFDGQIAALQQIDEACTAGLDQANSLFSALQARAFSGRL